MSQLENFTFWFQLENLFLIIEIFFENLDFDFFVAEVVSVGPDRFGR